MKKTRLLALLLVFVMVCTMLASCFDNGGEGGGENVEYVDPYKDIEDYDEKSAAIYDDILGDFYDAYMVAKAETNVSKKFALMAIAEAKLLESGVMLPTSTNGGNYAISRVAPYTVPFALWGNDSYRYHNALVATEFITAEDRAEMKAQWNELKGTGTYEAWAKQFLADNGYTLKNTYTLGYSSDPQTWDVLATSKAADSEAIVNTYDGLYEYDSEGNLLPALATDYTVSEDGLTYTFTIREGEWVNSQGVKVADIKADDFVAGMQHMMDAAGGLEYLVQGIIKNASEYIKGEVTDFSQVGVKAVDDRTLVYTLEAPCSYFMTMLGYGVFAPMSREFYVSQGGKFGADYNSSAETYSYGKTPENIAYCGPYRVTNLTASNTIVFSANASYWNKDNINIQTITWLYNDGQDVTKAYNDAVAGTLDGAGLNNASLELCKNAGLFNTYSYVSSTDATTFSFFYNINRLATSNFNDDTVGVTTHTDASLERATAALRNEHFRRAVSFAIDRGAYNAQAVGETLKLNSLRNSYTPGNFVSLAEEVTVSINGTNKTYPAGTWYGEIMQDQINADGVAIKVWDPEAEEGAGSSDGFDGWYNPEEAAEELEAAIEELAAIGIEVSEANPITIELPYFTSETYTNRANSAKQSIESALGGKVKVALIALDDIYDWYYAGYYAGSGAETNYDFYDCSGWGPDYGDPSTYLDTFLPDYSGYMTMMLGIF